MSREALVVGINRYPLLKDPQTKQPRHLLKPAADAEAVAQILETYGNFRVQRLPEMVNDQGKWQVNPSPQTRELPKVEHLKQAISQLLNPPSNPPQTALLFFAGHGLLEETGGIKEGYLATSDAKPPKTWGVSFHWLTEVLKNSPVPQIIIWLDCCHSGALLNLAQADPGNISGQKKDLCFIAACRDFEVAYEEFGGEHGILTGALLSGLNPENHSEDWVTNYTLIDGLTKELAKTKQSPIFHNMGGEILLTGEQKKLERAILMANICPYKGLESFGFAQEDSQFFYGRTRLTDELLDRVRLGNFLAVVGASGSGKSSVVKAGLLYQLKLGQRVSGSDRWPLIIFRPGEDPLQNLSRALSQFCDREIEIQSIENLIQVITDLVAARKCERVILVLDQFEEVFTLCESLEKREEFFAILFGALNLFEEFLVREEMAEGSEKNQPIENSQLESEQISREAALIKLIRNKIGLNRIQKYLTVILTMRSDFFGKCTERAYTGLAEKIKHNLVPVMPMESEELQEAIIQPAYQVGLEVQRELVQQILQDVSGPGSLPLMQYTLMELWRNRQVNRLTLAEYTRLGGVKGTLQKRADEIYQELSNDEQLAAKRIFLELTQLGEGTEDTRRQIYQHDLVNEHQSIELLESTLKKLTDARLLVTSELQARGNLDNANTVTAIDVAHEALIRHWPRLKSWLNENRAAIRIERKIEASAEEWENHRKPKHDLLTGSKLVEAENYLQDYAELGLLSALGKEYIEKSIRQRNINRWIRLGVMAGFIGGLTVFAGVATYFWFQATRKAIEAETNRIKTEAFVATQDELNPVKSLTMAIHLTGLTQQQLNKILPSVEFTLSTTVSRTHERQKFVGHESYVNSVAISPDGQTIASGSSDNTVRLWDRQGNQIAVFSGHEYDVNSVAISSDGQTIVSGSDDKTVRLWDRQGKLIAVFRGHEGSVTSVAISPDGQTIVSGSDDNTVRLWDRQGKLIAVFRGHEDRVTSVAISPDGQTIVSGSWDKTGRLWDRQGNQIAVFRGHESSVNSVAISPDGQTIVSGSADKTIRLWDRKGNQLAECRGHEDGVISVAISPDGQTIVSGSSDKTIRLWDREGEELQVLKGHEDSVRSVVFSPDGQTMISGSDDNTVRSWNREDRHFNVIKGHENGVDAVAFSPDGQTIASGSDDNTVRLWDREGNQLGLLEGHEDVVNAVAFSPDGQTIASGSDDNTVRLWDREGKLLNTLEGHENDVTAVAFSPDGQTIASGSYDKTVRLWDREGNPLKTLEGHKSYVMAVAFSPDGQTIASGSWDNTVRLWDREGKLLKTLEGHESGVRAVAFSPDGQTIASGSSADKTLRLWDRKGNQLKVLKGHEYGIYSVAFSPDGSKIVSGSWDNTVRLWDVQSRSELAVFKGHEDAVSSVAFSPDGSEIVSGSDDKTIRQWPSVWQSWLDAGCDQLRLHQDFVQAFTLNPTQGQENREIQEDQKEDQKIAIQAVKTCEDSVNEKGQSIWNHQEKAEFYIQQGLAIAKLTGNFAQAKDKFDRAQQLDSQFYQSLGYDPEVKAKEYRAFVLVLEGEKLGEEGTLPEAIAKFKEAKTLNASLNFDPEVKAKVLVAGNFLAQAAELRRNDQFSEALTKYQEAEKLDAQLEKADEWTLYSLCWFGSLRGHGAEVMTACNILLKRDTSDFSYWSSRGLARAMTGDYAGAISDFETSNKIARQSIQDAENEEDRKELEEWKAKCEDWIEMLRQGKNPFTPEVLEELL